MIRSATSQDLAAVHAINQANTPHVGAVDLAWFEKYLREACYFRVVELNGQIAAYLVAMLPSTDYKSENFQWFKKNFTDFLYIDRVAVSAEFTRQGLGRRLYDDVAEFARTKKIAPLITCEVNIRPANPESLAFHEKMGFTPRGELETKGGMIRVRLLGKDLS